MLFKTLAQEWFEKNQRAWAIRTQDGRHRLFDNHVYPVIGDMDIKDIKSRHILKICQNLESQGKTKTVRTAVQLIKRMFAYAIISEHILHNPASDVLGVCQPHQGKHYPFLPTHELTDFFHKVNVNGKLSAQAKRAFLLIAMTALRSQEVLKAQWSEFDFKEKVWTIPAERVKTRTEHKVPLTAEMIKVLRIQQKECPSDTWVFPAPNYKNKPLNAWTLSRAIHHAGYGGRQVLHGFRHIFSTYAYESNQWRDDVIESCLSHQITGVRGVYNQAKYWAERVELTAWYTKRMAIWAKDLEIEIKGENHG